MTILIEVLCQLLAEENTEPSKGDRANGEGQDKAAKSGMGFNNSVGNDGCHEKLNQPE